MSTDFTKDLANQRRAYPRYANFFLDYEKIRLVAAQGSDPQELAVTFRQELDKVNDIVDLEWEVIQNELKACLRKSSIKDKSSLENLKDAILALGAFVNTNLIGFRRIVRTCADQQSGSFAWFAGRLEAAPFRQRNFDVALGQLGHLYAVWRQAHPLEGGYSGPGRVLDDSIGTTARTFFIPHEKVMLVKATVLQFLRPDARGAKARTLGPLYWRRHSNQSASYDFKRHVTQVYFDNKRGDQYMDRRRRRVSFSEGTIDEGGGAPSKSSKSRTVFRCRWVGDNTGGPDFEVHVDVEGTPAVCIPLAQRDLPALLAGSLNPSASAAIYGHAPDLQQALTDVLDTIKDCALRPSLRASFLRSTFVGDTPDDGCDDNLEGQATLATIDEELSFRDEIQDEEGKPWSPIVSSSNASSGVGADGFPGAILRLRAGLHGSIEPLVQELASLSLREVPGFSKGLHGMALLHRQIATPSPPWCPREASEYSGGMPLLPMSSEPSDIANSTSPEPWEKPLSMVGGETLEKGTRDEGSGAAKATPIPAMKLGTEAVATVGDGLAARLSRLCYSSQVKDVELRVDAKTPMANERTLLRWLRSAVLLSALSAFLSSCAELGSRINGFLLALVSLLFVFGPLASFRHRSQEIGDPKAKKPRQDYVLQQMLGWSLTLILVSSLAVDLVSR